MVLEAIKPLLSIRVIQILFGSIYTCNENRHQFA
ncbi:MAG: hypothetical protein ACI97X_000389, partial [Oceanospirillaceae bacterium]